MKAKLKNYRYWLLWCVNDLLRMIKKIRITGKHEDWFEKMSFLYGQGLKIPVGF